MHTVTLIPHLKKRKTPLEPDAMRAMMFVDMTKPSPPRCIHYEARRSAVPVRRGEELNGYDGAVRPAGVPEVGTGDGVEVVDRAPLEIGSATFLVLLTNKGSSRLSNTSSVSRTRGLLSCIVPELSVSLLGLLYPFR